MTSAQLEYPTRVGERPGRSHSAAVAAWRPRRTGMVSEAVVARYIRDLSEHGRRVHGVADAGVERPQVAAR